MLIINYWIFIFFWRKIVKTNYNAIKIYEKKSEPFKTNKI